MPDDSGPGLVGRRHGDRPPAVLRVVIADDHGVLRAGTRQILEDAGGFEVVGEAADGQQAIDQCARTQPDLVLLDLRMPVCTGLEVAAYLAANQPAVTVVMVSAYDDDAYVRAALASGVAGYLLKTMPAADLVQAVRSAAAGATVLDPAVSVRLAGPGRSPEPDPLTWRERQVVDLVAQGLANKVVASRLHISTRTVEGHLNHVFAKLGVSSRTELVRLVLGGDAERGAAVPR